MNNEKTRSFICIDFPDEVTKEVARVQRLLEKQRFAGKLTELENLHITLKFLGSLDKKTLEKTKKALSQIKFPILDLSLNKTGIFQYKGKPKIVWIKTTGDIFNLQKQIDNSLSGLFKPEHRFMSHLTIARIKHVKNISGFYEYVNNIKLKKIKFTLDSFRLKSSELKPEGPVYETIKEYKLHSPTS